jgi:hypothetical protein
MNRRLQLWDPQFFGALQCLAIGESPDLTPDSMATVHIPDVEPNSLAYFQGSPMVFLPILIIEAAGKSLKMSST